MHVEAENNNCYVICLNKPTLILNATNARHLLDFKIIIAFHFSKYQDLSLLRLINADLHCDYARILTEVNLHFKANREPFTCIFITQIFIFQKRIAVRRD